MKKIRQHLLSYGLLAACLTTTQASIFSDVPISHWASPFVSQAEESNLVSGVGDTLFSPDSTMTYGQFSVMICNGAYDGKISLSTEDTHWASGFFRQLDNNKLFETNGISIVPPSENVLDAPITREVVAVVVSNLLMAQGFEPGDVSLAAQFQDVASASLTTGEQQSIGNMVAHGIMTGDDEGKFGLGTSLTRAQASVIVKNMLDLGVLTPLTVETTPDQSTFVQVVVRSEYDLANLQDPILETAGIGGDTILATSNGREITAREVLSLTVSELDFLAQYAMYGEIPWGEETDGVLFEEGILKNSLELALIYQIIFEVAENEGISLEQSYLQEVQDYLDEVLAELGGNQTHFQYVLWQALTTVEDYKRNSEANELFNLIYNNYFGEGGSRVPDDASVVEYMEEHGYYSVKHILISTLDDGGNEYNTEDKALALAKTQVILADLQASDDLEGDFHQKMLAYSEDPGSLAIPEGYTAYPGQMVSEFETASLLLEENTMSDIVESVFGYHIIYRQALSPDSSARNEYIKELSVAMQEKWLADNPLTVSDLCSQLDMEQFYHNLTVLRKQIQTQLD